MHRPTASALPLLARCPGQSVLDHYPTTSAAAEEGSTLHEELIPAIIDGVLPDTPRGRAIARLDIAVSDARSEVAYAVNLERFEGRELRCQFPRDYSDCRDGEIPGTADIVMGAEHIELKTGYVDVRGPWGEVKADGGRRWYPTRQQLHGALARWFLDSRDIVRLRLVHARPPDRAGRSFAIAPVYTPSVGELMLWRDDLMRIMERVHRASELAAAGDRVPLVLGEHCGCCSARTVCPAIGDNLGHANAADAALAARAAMKRARTEVQFRNAMLMGEEVAEDGRTLAPVTTYARCIDSERAMQALPGLRNIVTLVVTATDVDEYARGREDLGKYHTARRRAVNEILEEGGALTWTASTTHKEGPA